MSVEELVKRLRHSDEYEPLGHDGWEAADKLEELAAHSRLQAEDIMTLGQMVGKAEAALAEAKRENEALREACNQSRLAFAGMVSVQSAIDKLDTLPRNAGGKNA